ncbi:MAG: alanine racemase [Armatimonadota bacterium]|nr:alanine racemase [Armatimonadota bacterium]MDR7444231.1 alanine racemase [Armatimonadota bacterium]MDR7570521.1 alanine racemase [Armatimonadota bacterium]MDR7614234.1 alanine racemase [Armatimonadota bacterium]
MRPARVEVDLAAVRHNVVTVCGVLGRSTQLMAVVKADAYGHGMVPVARAAVEAGAAWLGVAFPPEAKALRQAGISAPVLVLGPATPEEMLELAPQQVSFSVFSPGSLEAARQAAARSSFGIAVHLEVDTGMRRFGFPPEEAVPAADAIASTPGLHLEGIYTHFATADEDPAFARTQLRRFQEVLGALESKGHRVPFRHAANSAATFTLPDAHYDLVRVGIALYGLSPGVSTPALRPALRLVAQVVQVRRVPEGTRVGYGGTYRTPRETTLVTVPVGYADGLPRSLSGRGRAFLRETLVRYAGRVCMDALMLDVGDLPVEEGDEVELLGPHVPVEEVASACGTIPHEIVSRLSPYLPRVYR